jgi:hypothetical protein
LSLSTTPLPQSDGSNIWMSPPTCRTAWDSDEVYCKSLLFAKGSLQRLSAP